VEKNGKKNKNFEKQFVGKRFWNLFWHKLKQSRSARTSPIPSRVLILRQLPHRCNIDVDYLIKYEKMLHSGRFLEMFNSAIPNLRVRRDSGFSVRGASVWRHELASIGARKAFSGSLSSWFSQISQFCRRCGPFSSSPSSTLPPSISSGTFFSSLDTNSPTDLNALSLQAHICPIQTPPKAAGSPHTSNEPSSSLLMLSDLTLRLGTLL
jgi:hypothetical protein